MADEDKKTRKVAEHSWLAADGSVVEKQTDATGLRYQDVATGESVDFQIPGATPGNTQTLYALFGAKTLAINTASQARQARARGEADALEDVAAIRARFKFITDGQWKAEGDGNRGPRWDLDVLAQIMVAVLETKGKKVPLKKLRGKLEDDLGYRRKAMNNTEFRDAYNAAKGIESNVEDFADLD